MNLYNRHAHSAIALVKDTTLDIKPRSGFWLGVVGVRTHPFPLLVDPKLINWRETSQTCAQILRNNLTHNI